MTPRLTGLDAIIACPGRSASDKLLLLILDRMADDQDAVTQDTTELAQRTGLSVRSVQVRLDRLTAAQLIRLEQDHTLPSRRRLVLAWRVRERDYRNLWKALEASGGAGAGRRRPHRGDRRPAAGYAEFNDGRGSRNYTTPVILTIRTDKGGPDLASGGSQK